MAIPLTAAELAALRAVTSPTIANAIELLKVRSRTEGYMDGNIQCRFPELGVLVGYASPAIYQGDVSPAPGHGVEQAAYWRYTQTIPAPRLAVSLDISQPVATGATWGDVMANTHIALGFVGAITNGAVRDMDEVRALGFQFYARSIVVSHAYSHMVDFGVPVVVGGVTIKPGDLLHCDQHGVVIIPDVPIADLLAAVEQVNNRESRLISLARTPGITIDGLLQGWKEINR